MPQASSGTRSLRNRLTPTYFFLRGLAIILPPVLTLLILLWALNGINTYVVQPVNSVVRYSVALANHDIRKKDDRLFDPPAGFPPLTDWHRQYRITDSLREIAAKNGIPTAEQLGNDPYDAEVFVPMGKGSTPGQFVPLADYNYVFKQLRPQPPPVTGIGLYMEIAGVKYFRTAWQLSAVALSFTIIVLYFLGRFVTAKIGTWFVNKFEFLLTRVPFVRNVYSTVKQVTDFVLSDREVEFKRVVALEYPRAGAWTVGFVTGEGMLECSAAVGEPMITVLVPTSPMPAGGFTIMVPRSQVIDLDLTVDQALQFIVSCGVLTPPQQRANPERLEQELRARPQTTERAGATHSVDGGNGT
jgi:uncharacterized membrane protein